MLRPPPRHVGIILDGNRRHARRAGLRDFRRIYAMGAGKLDEVLDWCGELGRRAVTLWVCSTDNLARPAEEVSGILAAIEQKMRSLAADPQFPPAGVRVQAIGRLDLLPAPLAPRSRRLGCNRGEPANDADHCRQLRRPGRNR